MNNFYTVDAFKVDAAGFRAWLIKHFVVVKPCQNEFVRVRLSHGRMVMMFCANKKGNIAFHPEMWDLYQVFLQDKKLEDKALEYKALEEFKIRAHQNPSAPEHFLSVEDASKFLDNPKVPAGQYTIVIDSISNLVLEQGAKIGKISKQKILQDLIARHINEYVRKLA